MNPVLAYIGIIIVVYFCLLAYLIWSDNREELSCRKYFKDGVTGEAMTAILVMAILWPLAIPAFILVKIGVLIYKKFSR